LSHKISDNYYWSGRSLVTDIILGILPGVNHSNLYKLKSINDIVLWDLIQNKDSAKAFAQLYDRYWEQLYNIVYWRVCDEQVSKDIIQDVFITIWVKRTFIHIEHSLEAYLKVATRNKVLNYFKSEAARIKHSNVAAGFAAPQVQTPVEIIAAKDLSASFKAEVAHLPAKMREIFILNKEHGLTIEAIAYRLSLSRQTVKNQLTSASKKVRAGIAAQHINS
jgi:RNA polymerase sigma-70 factor (family 1)